MGIFTRRRPAPQVVTWLLSSGPEVVDAAAVEDDGNAGNNAFELTFRSPAAPASAIYVTFYAAWAAPDEGGYLIGYRYDLFCNAERTYAGWGSLGTLRGDERPYATPDDALAAAYRVSLGYAAGGPPIADEDLGGQVFTWDGQPW